jgi:hypothetical protein
VNHEQLKPFPLELMLQVLLLRYRNLSHQQTVDSPRYLQRLLFLLPMTHRRP